MPSLFDSLFSGARTAIAGVHGETVLFKGREDSEPRTVATIQCRLDGAFEQQGFAGEGTVETLYVGVTKDETSGIPETIRVGDGHRLYYRGDMDRPFIWKGRKQNDTADAWTLVFERIRQEVQRVRP